MYCGKTVRRFSLYFSIINSLSRKYNVQWYIAPLQIQKVILFLLQRGTKKFTMNIARLFVASLEGAASVRNISFKVYVKRNILNV